METRRNVIAAGVLLMMCAALMVGVAAAAEETASKEESLPVIKPWKKIVLDKDYRGDWIVTGDVDGDGKAEIISARNSGKSNKHHTCSVVAYRLDGSVLWKWGDPKIGRGKLYHDVACQIYDWDGDGKKEVIVAAREKIVEIDGATGKEKRSFVIPPNSSDCIVFCNLSGNKHASDVLVKTRYDQIWAYDYNGKQLWTCKNPGGCRTTHQPRPIDIDKDGKDEIITGYALLNWDGSLRWKLKDTKSYGGHLDCARVFNVGKTPEETSMIFTFCSGNRIAMINGVGEFVWSKKGRHFESADIGKVRSDIPGRQIIVDIDHEQSKGSGPLWILDDNGNFLAEINTPSSRFHLLIDWFGNGLESIVIGRNHSMYDGQGKKIAVFQVENNSSGYICSKGDMTGDGRSDLVLSNGSEVYIYKNEKGRKSPGKTHLGCGVNFTLY